MNTYKKIYKKIKKAKKIVIARHVGPDPDAFGSTFGLKAVIKNTFPKKEVYVVGSPTTKFRYLGQIDQYQEHMQDALLIVLDTPNKNRIDVPDLNVFKKIIKIDHHPFVETFGQIELIDETASSACQIIIELVNETKLKMNPSAAKRLYTGLVSDTNRFMFKYSTPKTFSLVAQLLEETQIDITEIYKKLYLRPLKEIKFQGYLFEHIKVTPNNVGYLIITEKILKEYNVDSATPGNMINNFNFIEEIIVWTTITYDTDNQLYRISIRSRGPIINEIAAKYGGGGHAMASGIKIKDPQEIQKLIQDLDQATQKYQELSKR